MSKASGKKADPREEDVIAAEPPQDAEPAAPSKVVVRATKSFHDYVVGDLREIVPDDRDHSWIAQGWLVDVGAGGP